MFDGKPVPDLNAVAAFVLAVQCGSIAGAARRMGIPANTTSRKVQQLEAELGIRLLHRNTRCLTLSNAGRDFYDRCAPGIEQLAFARTDLPDVQAEPAGTLSVAAPPELFEFVPIDFLSHYMQRYRRVSLRFHLGTAHMDLVGQGVDLAFHVGRSLPDASMITRSLASLPVVVVAHPDYLARHGVPATPADLLQHECITRSGNPRHQRMRFGGPQGDWEQPVTGRLSINALPVLRRTVMAGLGLAQMSLPLVKRAIEQGLMVEVLADYRPSPILLRALFSSRLHMPAAGRVLIDEIAAYFEC